MALLGAIGARNTKALCLTAQLNYKGGSNMVQTTEKSHVDQYPTDPYSARALILKLELNHNLDIRVYESTHHCMICTNKKVK